MTWGHSQMIGIVADTRREIVSTCTRKFYYTYPLILQHVGVLSRVCKYRVRPVNELFYIADMHLVGLCDDKG